MAKDPKPQTWMELGVTTVGLRDTFRAISWALDWATVRAVLSRDPSVDEVADWWQSSRRTHFRNQAAFRKAFPMLDTPAPLVDDPRAQEAIHAVTQLAADRSARNALKQARAIERASVVIGQISAT